MGNTSRKVSRNEKREAVKEGSKIYREAISQAEKVEADIKKTISHLPLIKRLGIAIRIILRRWQ